MGPSFLKMISNLFLVFITLGTLVTSYPFMNEDEFLLNSDLPSTGLQKLMKRSSRRLCGDALKEALSLVCDGRYASPTTKRNYIGENDNGMSLIL